MNPTRSQNSAVTTLRSSGSAACGAVSGAPQLGQNLNPSGLSVPQDAHASMGAKHKESGRGAEGAGVTTTVGQKPVLANCTTIGAYAARRFVLSRPNPTPHRPPGLPKHVRDRCATPRHVRRSGSARASCSRPRGWAYTAPIALAGSTGTHLATGVGVPTTPSSCTHDTAQSELSCCSRGWAAPDHRHRWIAAAIVPRTRGPRRHSTLLGRLVRPRRLARAPSRPPTRGRPTRPGPRRARHRAP